MAVDRKLTKSIGEHWVAATLARLGWAAALTRDGLARTDLLAVKDINGKRCMVEVQVKTASMNAKNPVLTSWLLGLKAQLPADSDHEWFVLVAVPTEVTEQPRAFVVPRNVVAAAAWVVHENWRTDPDARAGKRKASVEHARVRMEVWAAYENRWDLLDHPASQAVVLLPADVRHWAERPEVGLPPGHPWHEELPEW